MKNLKTREFILGGLCIGLGIAVLVLGIKTSRQSEEIRDLKSGMSDLNETCDKKNRYIGQILTEIKIKQRKK